MPASKFLPTEVHRGGLTALIQNLGRDCHPTQFLREFSKNALEACIRTGEPDCQVVVDYNQSIYNSQGVHKICFVDTGDGMSESQMTTAFTAQSWWDIRSSNTGRRSRVNQGKSAGYRIQTDFAPSVVTLLA